MREVLIYLREGSGPINPKSLNSEPISFTAQATACQRWLEDHDCEAIDWIEERATAHTPLRGLGALLRLLMSLDRGQTLLIYARAQLGLDALGLSFVELEVQRRGGVIRSATEPDYGQGPCDDEHSHLVNIINSYRKQVTGGKIKAKLDARLSRGYRAGNVRLGWTSDEEGRLYGNPEEEGAIELVKHLRAQGMSVHEVQDELIAREITCRSGMTPSIPTISRWTYYAPGPHTHKVKKRLEDKVPHLGAEILRLRSEGVSYSKICEHLATLGYRSRGGKPYMANQVRRIYLRVAEAERSEA